MTVLGVIRPPAPVWAGDLIEIVLLLLAAAGATLVVVTRQPLRQVVMLTGYGLVLSLLFFVLQAPDVSLSELTVGSVILPLVVLLVLSRLRSEAEKKREKGI
jgi:energy-converting hydrogenase B subunit D